MCIFLTANWLLIMRSVCTMLLCACMDKTKRSVGNWQTWLQLLISDCNWKGKLVSTSYYNNSTHTAVWWLLLDLLSLSRFVLIFVLLYKWSVCFSETESSPCFSFDQFGNVVFFFLFYCFMFALNRACKGQQSTTEKVVLYRISSILPVCLCLCHFLNRPLPTRDHSLLTRQDIA